MTNEEDRIVKEAECELYGHKPLYPLGTFGITLNTCARCGVKLMVSPRWKNTSFAQKFLAKMNEKRRTVIYDAE